MANIFYFLKKIYLNTTIRYFIWDFDGTLYQDNNHLGQDLKQAFFNLSKSKIPKLTVTSFDKAVQKFGSWSSAASHFTKIDEFKVLDEIDKQIHKKKYIKKNLKIVSFIKEHDKFKHLILTNSTSKEVLDCLPAIGFTDNPFEKVFSRDITHLLKPNSAIFSKISSYTKSPKFRHICIGDSTENDIKPAQEFGFQAIPVWEIDKLL